MRGILLLFLSGCSTALSAIDDAEVERIRVGMHRSEVEDICGGPDGERRLEGGMIEVVYHVTLGIPERDGLNTGSLQAAGTTLELLQGDWDCLWIIPLTITAATFVVAEGVNIGREIHRLNQGERFDVRVLYARDLRVISHSVVPRGG